MCATFLDQSHLYTISLKVSFYLFFLAERFYGIILYSSWFNAIDYDSLLTCVKNYLRADNNETGSSQLRHFKIDALHLKALLNEPVDMQ